jgi:hypothetical protein
MKYKGQTPISCQQQNLWLCVFKILYHLLPSNLREYVQKTDSKYEHILKFEILTAMKMSIVITPKRR